MRTTAAVVRAAAWIPFATHRRADEQRNGVTMASARAVSAVLRFLAGGAVFVVLLLLALSNTEPVTIRLFRTTVFESPLAFVVFVAFAAGVAAGLVAGAMRVARLKRILRGLRRRGGPAAPGPHGATPSAAVASARSRPPDAA